MSPGSRPRPSLSGMAAGQGQWRCESVAGVSAPAFVERGRARITISTRIGVSPGSRPRPSLSDGPSVPLRGQQLLVSPGSRPRPSLSAPVQAKRRRIRRVSPGSRPRPSLSDHCEGGGQGRWGCVAGVSAPAFVERARSGLWARCGLCGRRVSAPLTPLRRWQDDKA